MRKKTILVNVSRNKKTLMEKEYSDYVDCDGFILVGHVGISNPIERMREINNIKKNFM